MWILLLGFALALFKFSHRFLVYQEKIMLSFFRDYNRGTLRGKKNTMGSWMAQSSSILLGWKFRSQL
jgi:hypothetical protein